MNNTLFNQSFETNLNQICFKHKHKIIMETYRIIQIDENIFAYQTYTDYLESYCTNFTFSFGGNLTKFHTGKSVTIGDDAKKHIKIFKQTLNTK